MIKHILSSAALIATFSFTGNAMVDNEEIILDSTSKYHTKEPSLTLSADIKSRHTWRGNLTCTALNIQPTLDLKISKITLGAWGCYTADNSYAEVDLYAIYHMGPLSFSLLDYYSPNEAVKQNDFFQFDRKTTRHIVDANMRSIRM